jgi:ribose transport system ATP-binding protein
MLAIVRAVEELRDADGAVRRGLLLLDEPSASFTIPEKEWLYRTIRTFTAGGGAVVFISHDIDEIFEITDEVTVLRDGRVQATVETRSVNGSQLAELIVGRHVSRHDRHGEGQDVVSDRFVRVAGLTGGAVSGADFDVRAGEIVGLTGLAGSGFEDVLPLVFGSTPAEAGSLEIGGETHDIARLTPQSAMRAGLAFVPGDRERQGCVLGLPISDNVTLCSLDDYRGPAGLSRRRMRGGARAAIGTYGIRAAGASASVGTLSGGNQQKVLVAKWLAIEPRLLLLQEPTVGLDIGARLDILALVRDFATRGSGVVCASSDWEQLADICDRVVIFANGRVASVIEGAQLTESGIGHECYRVSAGAENVLGE